MNKETKIEKLRALIAHIDEVQKNCQKLGFLLMETGEDNLGRKIIANSFLHDNTKFYALEWLHLTCPEEEDELLAIAIHSHVEQNTHHPEYWGGIKNMPRIYIAEMVCDWKARSSTLGNGIWEWIETKATKKFKFSKRDKVFKDISYFVNLILDPGI